MDNLAVESVEANGDAFKLKLTNGSALLVGAAYLPPELPEAFLCAAPLDPETEALLRYGAACYAAEKAALRLIARCEQCRRGLERKLEQRRHQPEAVLAALDRLEALDLLNDRRYAELWLKYRLGRNKGPRFLLFALRAKVNRANAEAALAAVLAPDVEAALLEQCIKKYGPKGARKPEIKYFLKTQGFSPAAIEQYFEEADRQAYAVNIIPVPVPASRPLLPQK